LSGQQFDFLEDASNQERCYTRNRIRLDLLPLMKEFNPRVEEGLAALSRKIGLEEDYWDQEVEKSLASYRSSCPNANPRNSGWTGSKLLALHPALRARVLRRALGDVRGNLGGICGCASG
jgi:tRNA(Ile)-lysidine synthase